MILLEPSHSPNTITALLSCHYSLKNKMTQVKLYFQASLTWLHSKGGSLPPDSTLMEGSCTPKHCHHGWSIDMKDQGNRGWYCSPMFSGSPIIRLRFCTAWPDAPFTRLSICRVEAEHIKTTHHVGKWCYFAESFCMIRYSQQRWWWPFQEFYPQRHSWYSSLILQHGSCEEPCYHVTVWQILHPGKIQWWMNSDATQCKIIQ